MTEIPKDKREQYFELMAALQTASHHYWKTHGMNNKTEFLYLIETMTWNELQEAHLVNDFNDWKKAHGK